MRVGSCSWSTCNTSIIPLNIHPRCMHTFTPRLCDTRPSNIGARWLAQTQAHAERPAGYT
eukprot:6784511-Prymnesium_polylepis.2